MAELKGKRKGNKKKYDSGKRDTEFSEEFKNDLNIKNDMKTNSSTKKIQGNYKYLNKAD